MIDISTLTPEEVKELDKQLQKYKKSEKNLSAYKVSFYVRFNPEFHKDDALTCDGELEPVVFADYMADALGDYIIRDFKLKSPEDICGIEVYLATKAELESIRVK
jgi:hypothetical protein